MSVTGTAGKNAGRSESVLEIIPLPHALGAEVRCDDVRALDDASAAAILQAFLDVGATLLLKHHPSPITHHSSLITGVIHERN